MNHKVQAAFEEIQVVLSKSTDPAIMDRSDYIVLLEELIDDLEGRREAAMEDDERDLG